MKRLLLVVSLCALFAIVPPTYATPAQVTQTIMPLECLVDTVYTGQGQNQFVRPQDCEAPVTEITPATTERDAEADEPREGGTLATPRVSRQGSTILARMLGSDPLTTLVMSSLFVLGFGSMGYFVLGGPRLRKYR